MFLGYVVDATILCPSFPVEFEDGDTNTTGLLMIADAERLQLAAADPAAYRAAVLDFVASCRAK